MQIHTSRPHHHPAFPFCVRRRRLQGTSRQWGIMSEYPRDVEAIVDDFALRRGGLLKALTEGGRATLPFNCVCGHIQNTLQVSGSLVQTTSARKEHLSHHARALAALPPQTSTSSSSSAIQKETICVCMVRTLQGWGHARGWSWQTFSPRALGMRCEHSVCTRSSIAHSAHAVCMSGHKDGTWSVDLPAEDVPPELPEPALGINFARDGMQKRDWLALVAVHCDAWLMAVAFFYAVKLDAAGRCVICRSGERGAGASLLGSAAQTQPGPHPPTAPIDMTLHVPVTLKEPTPQAAQPAPDPVRGGDESQATQRGPPSQATKGEQLQLCDADLAGCSVWPGFRGGMGR